jgi:hypothetical protein
VSEDDSIRRFEPRPTPTALTQESLVWAVDTRHLPLFWFPRDCPRGTFWAGPQTTAEDAERFLLGTASRVHAIEGSWLDAVRGTRVVAYRMPEETFAPHAEVGGYWVSSEPVEPAGVMELGDLLSLHADAGIELRVVPSLEPLWRRVIAATLEFSGCRLRNASPPIT